MLPRPYSDHTHLYNIQASTMQPRYPKHQVLAADDNSSEMSISPSSSTSSIPSPQFAFMNPSGIPPKSLPSQPSTTSSNFSLSPSTPLFPNCNVSATCAYPSWPNRDFLSPTSSPKSSYTNPHCMGSSYVSDEDLLDLAQLDLYGDSRIPTVEIPWEATRQPPVVIPSPPMQARPAKKRRRSSPLKRSRPVKGLSPITEGTE